MRACVCICLSICLSVCLSVCLSLFKKYYELQGGVVLSHKRRAWLDNVVLKHQSSALVPIFDPRPGKAIIPTLVDMPIPSPGMPYVICVYVYMCMCMCMSA